jgi:LPXTG-motif cell wall-anchored protein
MCPDTTGETTTTPFAVAVSLFVSLTAYFLTRRITR